MGLGSSSRTQKNSYLPLHPDEDEKCSSEHPPKGLSLAEVKEKLWGPVLIIVLFVVFIILSISAVRFTEAGNRIANLSPVPNFASTRRTFQETPTFENHTTEADVSEAWGKYGLPSYGFVSLPHPEDYGLPPNHDVVPGTANTYMISVYHQLHCLKALHVALIPTIHGHGSHHRRGIEPRGDDGFEHNHIEHCLDYLRQSVMCSGDTTLEPPDEHPEKGKSPLQGWGVEHTCRSWEEIEYWRGANGVL